MNSFTKRRAVSAQQRGSYKLLKSQNKLKKNKQKFKAYCKYQHSNEYLNELIKRMKCFKALLNRTHDLKSILILDTYGVNYSNEVKKIINKNKGNIYHALHNYTNSKKSHEKNEKLKGGEKKSNISTNISKKNINIKSQENNNNIDNGFDLTTAMDTKRDKYLGEKYLFKVKNRRKLLNLKAQIFLLEKNKLISDKKNQNLEFIRANINKSIYNKIKSKYKRPNTAIYRSKANIDTKTYNINGRNKNHKNKKDNFYKINHKSNIENITDTKEDLTSNILLYKTSRSRLQQRHIPIRDKFKQTIFSKEFKDTVGFDSRNESALFNKTAIKYYPNRKNKSQNFNINYSSSVNSKKNYFIDSLNKLENKSNIINQDFSIFTNESQDLGNKLFNRTYKGNKNTEEINVKEINEYFNFGKGGNNNIESLLKNNAKKVKKIMDPRCGRILDKIVKKLCLEENKLHKNHFLSFRNDKILEKKSSILRKYNKEYKKEKEKKENKNNIFDMFKDKDEDIYDVVKNKINYMDDIEQQYIKTKIINKFRYLKS